MEEAVNAIYWVQRMAGMETVSVNPLIRTVVDGFQRILAKPRKKKEPVTPQMLQELVASMGAPPSLSETRLAAICLLAFSAFLRYDEISKLCCCDITAKMEVHIQSSKTDQFRQGSVIPIARSELPTCPVAMLEKYIALGNIDLHSKERLFQAITKAKKGEVLRMCGSLSYTRMRELVLGKIKVLGYDSRNLVCTVSGQGVLQLLLIIRKYLSVILNVMVAGSLRQLRMVTSRILRKAD